MYNKRSITLVAAERYRMFSLCNKGSHKKESDPAHMPTQYLHDSIDFSLPLSSCWQDLRIYIDDCTDRLVVDEQLFSKTGFNWRKSYQTSFENKLFNVFFHQELWSNLSQSDHHISLTFSLFIICVVWSSKSESANAYCLCSQTIKRICA